MTTLAELDHTVINVRFAMDEAQGHFDDLGFFLTERGYHSLGSINHLMMFETDYIELIGLPHENIDNPGRPEIAKASLGINGLVFKTTDVDETFGHLQNISMAGAPPKSFTRPVTTADGTFDASFRTVHVRDDVFPGGRVYFCEHGTPELVWRPEWQNHGNGALAMPEFVIVSEAAATEAANFAKLLQVDVQALENGLSIDYSHGHILVMTPAAYGERYGTLASATNDRRSIFGAIVIRSNNLAAVKALAASLATSAIVDTDRVIVRDNEFDTVLEFVA